MPSRHALWYCGSCRWEGTNTAYHRRTYGHAVFGRQPRPQSPPPPPPSPERPPQPPPSPPPRPPPPRPLSPPHSPPPWPPPLPPWFPEDEPPPPLAGHRWLVLAMLVVVVSLLLLLLLMGPWHSAPPSPLESDESLFCDSEVGGSSALHTQCRPCPGAGFCAGGQIWACQTGSPTCPP